jgi:hypothetical protein
LRAQKLSALPYRSCSLALTEIGPANFEIISIQLSNFSISLLLS